MKLEHGCIEVESCPEDDVSSWMPQIEALPWDVLVKVLMIILKFLLAIDILKHFSNVPPILIGLNHNGIRFDLLNKLLGSLSQHGGLIGWTNEENFFPIESLSEMNEGALKAVNSFYAKIVKR